MNKKNCVLCGRITSHTFCTDCNPKAREYTEKIRDYLLAHPNTSIMDIYYATSIPFAVIRGLLDEGWVELKI